MLIYSFIGIASKIKIPHQSNISPKEPGSCFVDSAIKDTMQERIVREIKEEAKQKEKEKLTYIKFTAAYLGKPNSAGGCDAHFSFKNTSKNTIKYLYIQYEIYNAVDDIVSDRFGRDDMELQYTGPLKPGRSDSGIWDCIIYDYSAKRLVITGLTIEYMDGMKIQFRRSKSTYKEEKVERNVRIINKSNPLANQSLARGYFNMPLYGFVDTFPLHKHLHPTNFKHADISQLPDFIAIQQFHATSTLVKIVAKRDAAVPALDFLLLLLYNKVQI